jgi:hypothetical protein
MSRVEEVSIDDLGCLVELPLLVASPLAAREKRRLD